MLETGISGRREFVLYLLSNEITQFLSSDDDDD
jgi:hypothetical protein